LTASSNVIGMIVCLFWPMASGMLCSDVQASLKLHDQSAYNKMMMQTECIDLPEGLQQITPKCTNFGPPLTPPPPPPPPNLTLVLACRHTQSRTDKQADIPLSLSFMSLARRQNPPCNFCSLGQHGTRHRLHTCNYRQTDNFVHQRKTWCRCWVCSRWSGLTGALEKKC